MKKLLIVLCSSILSCLPGSAQSLFNDAIEPLFRRECIGCHGPAQALSKLDLSSRESMIKGGARGPSLVPGSAPDSLLYQVIAGNSKLQMPPGRPLSSDAVELVKQWINGGAQWSQSTGESKWQLKQEDLWAFRPLPPFGKKSIDSYIDVKLSAAKITAAPQADKRILIRRATFDLTGLPPTPAEIEAFLADSNAAAFTDLVDRLLASPRYGERWGRHWLDVVRYADTNGYSNDFERPNAWRYRDYVIRAFNNDKPYDQFVREQIAGDELYPQNPEALIATGFLRSGPWEHTGMSVEAVTRQMFLDDVTHATASTFLGLTAGCARCHDHKFDPIPTADYYRLQAVFATAEFARRPLPFLATENIKDLPEEQERLKKIIQQNDANLKRFDELAQQVVMKKHGVTRAEELPPGVLAKAVRTKEGIGAGEFEEFKLYQKHGQMYAEQVDRFEPKVFSVSSGPLDGSTDGGPNLKYPDRSNYKAPQVFVLPGGNVQAPAQPVTPGVLSALTKYGNYPEMNIPSDVAGRRAALAQWIANPKNPLTARVMVNRIWQYHFGQGIAADTSNFGKMGAKPTNPELLDALANSFIASGWSIKALHRQIMLSNVYQRASGAATADPNNRLLAHFPPRRLEAEALRDSILAVAGELSLDAGGPGTLPQINEDAARQPIHAMGSLRPAYHSSPEKRRRNRRTIYSFQQRSMVDPMIEVFNGPALDLSCERRESSTVPTQAFTLFNSQFVHDMALAMAASIEKQVATNQGRIDLAFQRTFGRTPTDKERSLAIEHLKAMTIYHERNPAPPKSARKPLVHNIMSELTGEGFLFVQQEDPVKYEENLHPSDAAPSTRALAEITLALLNSNEFVYVY